MKYHCCPGHTPQERTMPEIARFFDFYDSVKRIHIFLYEIRKILTLIYVSLDSDPGYFMH